MMKKLCFALALLCLGQSDMQATLSDAQIRQAQHLAEDGYNKSISNGVTYLTKLRDKGATLDVVSMFGYNNCHQTLHWIVSNKKGNLRKIVINSQKALQELQYTISNQQRTQKLVESILEAVDKIADKKVSENARGSDIVRAVEAGNLAKAIHLICSGVQITNRQRRNIVNILKQHDELDAFSIALNEARIDYAPAFFHERVQSLFDPFFNSFFSGFSF